MSRPQASDAVRDGGGTAVEQHGVETIPDAERLARPRDLVTMLCGGNLALSVVVFGWLAILAGLGWWAAVTAIVVGTFAGSVAVVPLALLGLRSGTNNSVSSGAYFGVRGRLVASTIGLLLTLGYLALTVWTGGDAAVAGASSLLDAEPTDAWYAAGYALIAVVVVVIAIYGFRWLVGLNKVIIPVVGITMVLTVVATGSQFDPSYPGTPDQFALGSFWPTWFLVALTSGVAGPISYATIIGDWTRYISPRRHRGRSVLLAAWTGLFVGLVVPTVFGAFVAVVALDPDSAVAGLIDVAPGWLVVAVLVSATVGSLGQGGLNLYSMGLDLDAILPRLTRLQSTTLVAGVATGLVFLGRFVWDAETSVTTFVVVLTSLATPWAVVTMIGFRRTRGRFDEPSLQVFNRRERGGAYWYTGGWNLDATAAWLVGSVVGLMSNSTEAVAGPIADLLGGIDASVVTSGVTAGIVYAALVALRPQAHAAPAGRESPGPLTDPVRPV